MAILARRHESDRKHITAKVFQNAHDRSIVYNCSESNRTQFASLEIFVLIIANFILIWLFPLLSIVTNFLLTLKHEYYNGHSEGSYTGGTPDH